jgi:hypothetical protein
LDVANQKKLKIFDKWIFRNTPYTMVSMVDLLGSYLTEIKDRQRDDASTIPSAMPRHHHSFQTRHPAIADEIYWSIHQLTNSTIV